MRTEPKYEQVIAIIAGVRRAFARCKAHKEPSRLKAEIQKELPAYTVYYAKERGTFMGDAYDLRVWGNGITHGDCVYLSWHNMQDSVNRPWQEAFAYTLDRADPSDDAERERDEEKLVARLQKLEATIARARAEAKTLVEALPVPKSATIRAEAHFWTRPSSALAKRFPECFGGGE